MVIADPLGFVLGLEGLALLRAQAGDFGEPGYTEARISEIAKLLAADRAEFGEPVEYGAIDTVTGYRDWSGHYDDEGNPLIAVEQPVVRSILESLPTGRALDAACGTGRHAAVLAELGHEVAGVDSSSEMLQLARRKLPDADFQLGDLHDLPFPEGAFDIVVCGLALTHQPALEPVLREFRRVLKLGGHLVVSDIHMLSLYLGGVAGAVDAEGRPGRMPASRWLAGDYLRAALNTGLTVRACHEPRWGGDAGHGGPLAQAWCPEAAAAAYRDTPAAIIWQFQKP